MLIVSDFHDYYDSCLSTGVDKSIVFPRKTKVIPGTYNGWATRSHIFKLDDGVTFSAKTPPSSSAMAFGLIRYNIWVWMIGFCGHFFPIVKINKSKINAGSSTHIFYDAKSVEQFLSDEGIAIEADPKGSRKTRRWYNERDYSIRSKYGLGNIFDPKNWGDLNPLFRALYTPAFIFGEGWVGHRGAVLVSNPSLKNLEFMKKKDPFTAFQEIYAYMSGVLGMPEKPMIQISDKDKAAAKGHDGPYSFKKPPGGGKWR